MRESISNLVLENIDETIQRIQRQVRIESVKDKNPTDGTPYGQKIQDALEDFIAQAKEIGLRTHLDPNGRYAYAEMGPENGELFAVLGHLDVVPVGDVSQWTESTPFEAKLTDDKILGRGTLDDKGPVVINLMAVKMLKENGFEPKKRIRIIVGGDEESGSDCMAHYVKEQELPSISYTPDANFPCIFGEKTILQFDAKIKHENNFRITVDNAYNAVCDRVTYQGDNIDQIIHKLEYHKSEYKKISDNEIQVVGKSAHAMAPNLGVNAISNLVVALKEVGITSPSINFIYEKVANTYYGENWVGDVKDDISGPLTLNLAYLSNDGVSEEIRFDSRIPVLVEYKEIEAKYCQELKNHGFEYEEHDLLKKLYVSKDTLLVKTILNNYEEVTKVRKEPLTSGGGTYARAFDNCVAFGAVFEGMIDKMHQPNECLELKYIPMALEIYAKTIYDLTKD